ncbi:uncharacterized protein O3C94_011672 [Discoglossus pictus]
MGQEEDELIGFLTISMGRITGTLLLAVYYYSSAHSVSIISRSALGILLIILSVILSHAGFQKSFGTEPLVVTFCMTVSALWGNSGIIHLLIGNGILKSSEELKNAVAPGLAAISMAFFVMGCVGTLHKNGPLSLMAFALGLANIHSFALFYAETLGPSAIACNFLIVTVISVYLVALKFISASTLKATAVHIKTTEYCTKHTMNHLVTTGIIANMMSSFVFGGKLLGVTSILFLGQVPWVWTSGLYQLVVSIISFKLKDMLLAIFFCFKTILKFAEGYALLNQPYQPEERIFPLPFTVVLAILFLVLACAMALRNIWDGLYGMLFVIYCIALCGHSSGITHKVPQAINVAIFFVSIVIAFKKLYASNKTNDKITNLNIVMGRAFDKLGLKLGQGIIQSSLDSSTVKNQDAEIIGHAFDAIIAFSITCGGETSAALGETNLLQ